MPFGSEAMFQFTPRRGRRTAVPRRVDAAAFARSVSVKGATDVPSRAFLGGANKSASVTHAFVHRGAAPAVGELARARARARRSADATYPSYLVYNTRYR